VASSFLWRGGGQVSFPSTPAGSCISWLPLGACSSSPWLSALGWMGLSTSGPGWGYVSSFLSRLLILVKSHSSTRDLAAPSVVRLPLLGAKWHLNRDLIATGYSVFRWSNRLPLAPRRKRHEAHILLAPIEVVVFGGSSYRLLFLSLPSLTHLPFPI